jgi:hypothetical protein
MSTAIVVALISGGVSLLAAALSLFSARSVARFNSELEERRRARTKQEQAEELRGRYRDPLLGAAFDLQSRLYNIVAKTFLVRYLREADAGSRTYAVENTLYVLAEYLGWVEIIRREIQFLDLGEEVANRRWVAALERVRDTLARDDIDPVLRLFRGEQRAIGELMTVAATGAEVERRHECVGYAGFVSHREQPEFARWFGKLQADLELLARQPGRIERVVLLQERLVDVLDVLDPECNRFPADRRTRLGGMSPGLPAAQRSRAPDGHGETPRST